MAYRILIVDDEAALQNMVKEILTQAGYETTSALTCAQALEQFRAAAPDAVLLDVNLPDGDGFSLLGKLRENRDVPVLFLSARDEDADRLQGLGLGADDYITKPFVPVEVLARVRSQLRRYAQLGSRPEEGSGSITIGGIVLDDRTKTVTVEGEPVSLTPTEYAILHLLMANPGKVFSTKVLYESVWQEAALGSEGAVAVHIRHLREKIEINPSEPRYLKVVWGQGYKMEGGK